MILTCPLCRDEWIFTTKICKSCDKIRYYMEIYSKSKILEILDKVLVVQQHKDNKKDDKKEEKLDDKQIEINKENCMKEIIKTIEQQSLENVKNKKENYIAGDDNIDYERPTTRNKKK